MGHDHAHHHSPGANKKILAISLAIITSYMIVEVLGGLLTNSLALLADAGHMLSDALSLAVALLAFTFSASSATLSKTFGNKRFEILAAAFNGLTLMLISVYIFYESFDRFQNPPEVASNGMFFIASLGLLINILVAWIMIRSGDVEENLNMRSAYLHVISDMLGSVGAMVAAILIMLFGWGWADPVASIIVAVLVLRSGYMVTKAALHILMEGTPPHIDMEKIIGCFQSSDGIVAIHDLHVWSVTSGWNALSCRALVDESMSISQRQAILRRIEHDLEHQNIQHTTIQFEISGPIYTDSVLCKMQAEANYHS